MTFMLSDEAGANQITVSGDGYKYLIKVRRHDVGDQVAFRHHDRLEEECLYLLERIDGRNGYFTLQSRRLLECDAARGLHIGWCMVDPKTIEKTLPMLSELGVRKITFIRCNRSQNQFKPDLERLQRIQESSIMQSGRTSWIEFAQASSLKVFLIEHPDALVMDFGGSVLGQDERDKAVIIGCEGGFDSDERALFTPEQTRHFNIPMILRSETAVVAVCAALL